MHKYSDIYSHIVVCTGGYPNRHSCTHNCVKSQARLHTCTCTHLNPYSSLGPRPACGSFQKRLSTRPRGGFVIKKQRIPYYDCRELKINPKALPSQFFTRKEAPFPRRVRPCTDLGMLRAWPSPTIAVLWWHRRGSKKAEYLGIGSLLEQRWLLLSVFWWQLEKEGSWL